MILYLQCIFTEEDLASPKPRAARGRRGPPAVDGGRLSIVVGLKMGRDTPEKGVQDVKCSVVMPQVCRPSLFSPCSKFYSFDILITSQNVISLSYY